MIDTAGRFLATVGVGGDAGNVTYDPGRRGGQVLVDVQSRNQVVVIDATGLRVTRRVDVPGCDHPHGLALDPAHRLGFIACDADATLHILDLDTLAITQAPAVGDGPDVLAVDPASAGCTSPPRAAPSPCCARTGAG